MVNVTTCLCKAGMQAKEYMILSKAIGSSVLLCKCSKKKKFCYEYCFYLYIYLFNCLCIYLFTYYLYD